MGEFLTNNIIPEPQAPKKSLTSEDLEKIYKEASHPTIQQKGVVVGLKITENGEVEKYHSLKED